MKVKLQSIYANAKKSGWPGDIIDVSSKEAQDLVDRHYAEYVKAPSKKKETAAKPKPETATKG